MPRCHSLCRKGQTRMIRLHGASSCTVLTNSLATVPRMMWSHGASNFTAVTDCASSDASSHYVTRPLCGSHWSVKNKFRTFLLKNFLYLNMSNFYFSYVYRWVPIYEVYSWLSELSGAAIRSIVLHLLSKLSDFIKNHFLNVNSQKYRFSS